MVLNVIACTSFKYLPLRGFKYSVKKFNKLLDLCLSQFQLKECCNYSTEKNTDILNSVQMQKYLSFLANENPESKHKLQDERVIELLKNKVNIEEEIKTLENMSSEGDKELEKLIESEKKKYLASIQEIKNKLLNYFISSGDENDNRNIELRVEQGIGGEESRLFSEELFQMYINYANFKNWEVFEDIKSGYILIHGESVFGHMRYEAGVHRVQRVPETEKTGRTHTSTCSVIILPQPKHNEIEIKNRDLIVEKLKSSGPGGQNINKRESCVRIKHIPTGIVIENQTERFQNENLKKAIYRLKGILFNIEQGKILKERRTLRKEQAGTNDYADKIRTYNYSQNRVTDHRINYTSYNLRGFIEGNKELDELIKKVREYNKKKEFLLLVEDTLQSPEYKYFEKSQAGDLHPS